MSLIFNKLGIYGWTQSSENKVLGSLLTGDPILMVQTLGSAKSALAKAIGRALDVEVGVYDAAKSMFEDIIGFPNPEQLKHGKIEFVKSKVTCWNKELVLIDEVNRADPEMQSKWLEFIRGRTIMGYETDCKWIIGAMNPVDYEGTNVMDPAYIGRFAMFLYPTHVLDMSEAAREAVIAKVSEDDAPALLHWTDATSLHKGNGSVWDTTNYENVGEEIKQILMGAAPLYVQMCHDMEYIRHFLSRFAVSLREMTSKATTKDEKSEPIILDGRRLGLIYRAILSTRAVELAVANLRGAKMQKLQETALSVILSSIPTGLNDTGAKNSEQEAQIEKVFRNLQPYLEEERDPYKLDILFELLATRDITRKVEILLNEECLGTQNKNSGWTRVLNQEGLDISVLALVALQIEAHREGTLPPNVVDQLTKKLDESLVTPEIHPIQDNQMKYADRLAALVGKYSKNNDEMPQRLMAIAIVNEWLEKTADAGMNAINESQVQALEEDVAMKCNRLGRMITETGEEDDAGAEHALQAASN